MNRRVVVTGVGAVTPFGVGVDTFWDALIEGRSGLSMNTLFDLEGYSVLIGGQIPNFDPTDHIERKAVKRLDRYAQFAMIAMEEAFKNSALDMSKIDVYRAAVIFGSGIGGMNELESQALRLLKKGPSKVSAFTIPKLMVNAASGNISIAYGARGESIAVSTACASATNAMGAALEYIRRDKADVVFTGGAEAALSPLALAAFAAMKALSVRNDDPQHASRPFDKDRDGFVLSEGSGAVIFEELEHAKRRGAKIHAEVIGFASTSDAEHITQPCEDGRGAAEAMEKAIADAGICPEDVQYINAHGTSTPLGDVAETLAIKKVFGEHAYKLVVSSTKSSVGHSLGASGGIEAIATMLGMQQNVVPPTINLENPDERCDLDYCPNTARDMNYDISINNSFGFGGHNACMVLKSFKG